MGIGGFTTYSVKLRLSLLGLAVPAVVLAALGWSVLVESQHRLERGRIASDIYTALLEFELEKAGLRNWSYRRMLDDGAGPGGRIAGLARMQNQINLISAKADLAAQLDRQRGKELAEHEERLALLALLNEAVRKLDRDTGLLLLDQSTPDLAEVSRIDADFDLLRGVSLPQALAAALATEASALQRERDRANQSLSAARGLFLSAGGFGLIATLIMALLLARRLRQPLHHLDTGLQAYRAGDFTHRFTRFRDTEFIRLGGLLNAMATEVESARARDAENRAELEQNVAARTAELRRTVDELAASEGARQRLLADIGHELRTPVTVIRGEAQVALRTRQPGAQAYRGALERIVGVSRQMGDLIEDLLVLVRDPTGQPLIAPRDIDLAQALGPAIEAAKIIAAQRDVSLDVPVTLPDVTLLADPDRLRQVLTCLLDNALRYSHAGGQVTLAVQQTSAQEIAVEITDSGIGITPVDLDRVFDRGWRSDAARAHRPDGLGLGLAIARQLTKAQGGRLDIAGGPDGKGTRAVLHLPVTRPESGPESEPEPEKETRWKSC